MRINNNFKKLTLLLGSIRNMRLSWTTMKEKKLLLKNGEMLGSSRLRNPRTEFLCLSQSGIILDRVRAGEASVGVARIPIHELQSYSSVWQDCAQDWGVEEDPTAGSTLENPLQRKKDKRRRVRIKHPEILCRKKLPLSLSSPNLSNQVQLFLATAKNNKVLIFLSEFPIRHSRNFRGEE